VLVGVDFSPYGEAALAAAVDEAARRGTGLTVAHVWWNEPLETLADPGGDVVDRAGRAAGEQLAGAVAEVRRTHPGLAISERLIHSLNPEHSLIEASRDAGLVAVGSRGRGGFGGLLLGSVSQALVHHAHCPVLVVHPHSHRG
jgi:nucleotide-binding universal stress UspA family protein